MPIGNYQAPSLPTEHALRRSWNRLQDMLSRHEDSPALTSDRLSPATLQVLNEVASPPACGPLLDDLQTLMAQRVSSDGSNADAATSSPSSSPSPSPSPSPNAPAPWLQLVVLPPCDPNDMVGRWARHHGHRVVTPPAVGAALLDNLPTSLPKSLLTLLDSRSPELLVIPQLEHWLVRHQRGLHLVRALLAKLEALDRPCVVGCNSWAWAYLTTATGAGVLLPKAVVPKPFDAERLGDWFKALSQSENDTDSQASPKSNAESAKEADSASGQGKNQPAHITFRLASNGQSVLSTGSEEAPSHRYMKQLAANSLGIPWVAWAMWREGLRCGDAVDPLSDKARQAVKGDQRTLWLVAPQTLHLPTGHEGSCLLVLQSLLIHGELNAQDLSLTLPSDGDPDVVPSLIATGFVERLGKVLRVRPSAYPKTRELLGAAGYPMDTL